MKKLRILVLVIVSVFVSCNTKSEEEKISKRKSDDACREYFKGWKPDTTFYFYEKYANEEIFSYSFSKDELSKYEINIENKTYEFVEYSGPLQESVTISSSNPTIEIPKDCDIPDEVYVNYTNERLFDLVEMRVDKKDVENLLLELDTIDLTKCTKLRFNTWLSIDSLIGFEFGRISSCDEKYECEDGDAGLQICSILMASCYSISSTYPKRGIRGVCGENSKNELMLLVQPHTYTNDIPPSVHYQVKVSNSYGFDSIVDVQSVLISQ